MSDLNSVAGLIQKIRNQVCPKTSYATAGKAASHLLVLSNQENLIEEINGISRSLVSLGEFENIENLNKIEDIGSNSSGIVLIVSGRCDNKHIDLIKEYMKINKLKMVSFLLNKSETIEANKNLQNDEMFTIYSKPYDTFDIKILYFSRVYSALYGLPSTDPSLSTTTLLGFNKQPSVKSKEQFKFLWSNDLSIQQDRGKHRVLQRLANNSLHQSLNDTQEEKKYSITQWDHIIQDLLNKRLNDFHIYSRIRFETLGSTLEKDLQINTEDSKKSINSEVEGEDGRADHMVDLTVQCIPSTLFERFKKDKMVLLDYGCAEGAITARLGKKLGLNSNNIFGADVRTIPANGFTFVPLSAEDSESGPPPQVGSILPTFENSSVHLITAAMVFHHVTHIKSVLLELRRIISPQGILLLREHHCRTPDMGAFLDITHGLYSLAWSNPLEWPDFIQEYKAYYRSREEWNSLLAEAGFIRVNADVGSKAAWQYEAGVQNKVKKDGFIPNVIRAYYAAYIPDPNFQISKIQTPIPSKLVGMEKKAKRVIQLKDYLPNQKKMKIDEVIEVKDDIKVKNEDKHDKIKEASSSSEKVFESKKYPGKFYKINPVTGKTEWLK